MSGIDLHTAETSLYMSDGRFMCACRLGVQIRLTQLQLVPQLPLLAQHWE